MPIPDLLASFSAMFTPNMMAVLGLAAGAVALGAAVLGRRTPARPGGGAPGLGAKQRARAERRGRRGEDAVGAELRRLGLPALHDAVLVDRLGVTQMDHIARTPHGLVVIETKAMSGLVTGAADGQAWTRHLPGRAGAGLAFQNPRRQNYRHVRAVEEAVGDAGVPVWGVVVSAGSATYAGELAHYVIPVAGLAAALQAAMAGSAAVPAARLDAAWHRLCAAGAEELGRREKHLAQVGRAARRGGARWLRA